MQRWWVGNGCSIPPVCLSIVLLASPLSLTAQQPAEEPAAGAEARADAASDGAPDAKPAGEGQGAGSAAAAIRDDFVNFLHFAVIGRFDYAQAHAESLLQRPQITPLSDEAADILVQLSQQRPNAVETLVILINNSTIGEQAAKIMDLIRQAHRRRRMDPAQIMDSIQMLDGGPTERTTGMERLVDSGEYAVPYMLDVLGNPRQKDLHPYVAHALPRLGKPAVNPLTAALSLKNEVVQRFAAEALGRLGYPQALPYLKRAATGPDANPAVRQSAQDAVRRIVVADPGVKESPARQLFRELAEAYYAEKDSLCPDRDESRANVWMVEGQTIKPIDVPREIFCMVMSMRAAEASLQLIKDQPEVVALWLAANFRREARLGLDVQTSEAAAVDDPTRPVDFPRSIYFARNAGPECCNLVLSRGLRDTDRPVVLGAIAGLAGTAGPEDFNSQDPRRAGLAEAIRFPDQLVRIRAALVLARLLPQQPFSGADEVVPVLASAFTITGRKAYLVIEPDPELAKSIAADLQKMNAKVIVAENLELGLARAAEQVQRLEGIFLASDMRKPGPVRALGVLARDEHFALTPVVLTIKEGGMLIADEVVQADPRLGRVLVDGGSLGELLAAKAEQVAPHYGYQPLTPQDAVYLSLESARGLQRIAACESSVFDARMAEPALTQALNHHASEEVRIAATRVLALLNTPTAQGAIAKVALSKEQTPTLRIAAFGSLAESARWLGNRLNDRMTQELIEQAKSAPNLELRTAASEALGATINMPAELAVEAILKDTRGG